MKLKKAMLVAAGIVGCFALIVLGLTMLAKCSPIAFVSTLVGLLYLGIVWVLYERGK